VPSGYRRAPYREREPAAPASTGNKIEHLHSIPQKDKSGNSHQRTTDKLVDLSKQSSVLPAEIGVRGSNARECPLQLLGKPCRPVRFSVWSAYEAGFVTTGLSLLLVGRPVIENLPCQVKKDFESPPRRPAILTLRRFVLNVASFALIIFSEQITSRLMVKIQDRDTTIERQASSSSHFRSGEGRKPEKASSQGCLLPSFVRALLNPTAFLLVLL
jgi:hypothetical protein